MQKPIVATFLLVSGLLALGACSGRIGTTTDSGTAVDTGLETETTVVETSIAGDTGPVFTDPNITEAGMSRFLETFPVYLSDTASQFGLNVAGMDPKENDLRILVAQYCSGVEKTGSPLKWLNKYIENANAEAVSEENTANLQGVVFTYGAMLAASQEGSACPAAGEALDAEKSAIETLIKNI